MAFFSGLNYLGEYIGLIIAYLTFNLSFYVWVLCSFCRDLPVELEEAAMVEGYPRWQVLWRITYPLLRPGSVATAVLCCIFAWIIFQIIVDNRSSIGDTICINRFKNM